MYVLRCCVPRLAWRRWGAHRAARPGRPGPGSPRRRRFRLSHTARTRSPADRQAIKQGLVFCLPSSQLCDAGPILVLYMHAGRSYSCTDAQAQCRSHRTGWHLVAVGCGAIMSLLVLLLLAAPLELGARATDGIWTWRGVRSHGWLCLSALRPLFSLVSEGN